MDSPKKSETTKSIARSSLYGLTTWALPLALSFFGTPLIIKSLGVKDYGIYSLALGFVSSSFNFNFGKAVTKYIAQYRMSGENDKIRDVISATLFINIIVGFIGVFLICVFANILAFDYLNIAENDLRITVFSLYISAVIVFFLLLNQVFNSVLQGIHRFDTYSNIFNLNSILLMAGNVILAISGFGILALLLWNVIVTFFTFILAAIAAQKFLPEFGIAFQIKQDVYKLIIKYSAGIVGYQILANALLLFERSWITAKLGSENLTYYVVPMQLAIYIHAFVSSIMLVIFPLASELAKDKERLLKLYLKASKIVCISVFLLAFSLTVEGKNFLTLWMDADFAEHSFIILNIHVITFSLLAIQIISWNLVEGLGYPSYNLLIFVICLLINVSLIFLFTSDYQNVGVAVGRLGGFGTMFLSVFVVERWIFGQIQTRFWLRLLITLSFASIIGAAIQKLIIIGFDLNWLTFILGSSIGGLFYVGLVWFSGLISGEEKLLIKNLIFSRNL